MTIFKRLKISPTFIIFNAAILCLAIQSAKSTDPILYFCMWLLLVFEGLNVALVTLQWFQAKKILASRNIKSSCVEGDTVKTEISLSNKNFMPIFNVCIEDVWEDIPEEERKRPFFECIPKKKLLKTTYDIKFKKRGKYIAGPIKIHFFDMLGMISFDRQQSIYSALYVYPKTFPITKFPTLKKGNLPWFGVDTRRSSGDEDEFFGLREYKEGDPIKKIHWFSTARKRKLIVKEFQRISFYKASILFVLNKKENIGKGKESVGEYIIKIASSVSKYLLENDVGLEVMAHAGNLSHFPFNKGFQYLDELMEFFAAAKIDSHVKIDNVIKHFSPYISPDSTIILIITEKNLEDISQFLYSQRYHVSIILIIVLSFSFDYSTYVDKGDIRIKDTWRDILSGTGIKTFFVSRKSSLEGLFIE